MKYFGLALCILVLALLIYLNIWLFKQIDRRGKEISLEKQKLMEDVGHLFTPAPDEHKYDTIINDVCSNVKGKEVVQ